MKTHTGGKPYQSSFCDKDFIYEKEFRMHMTIHTVKRKLFDKASVISIYESGLKHPNTLNTVQYN